MSLAGFFGPVRSNCVLVDGPRGTGKTTFVERLLESSPDRLLAVARFVVDHRRPKPAIEREATPEVARYAAAGSADALVVRYAARRQHEAVDPYLERGYQMEWTEGLLVEGSASLPLAAGVRVFVARPLPRRQTICRLARVEVARIDDPDAIREIIGREVHPGDELIMAQDKWVLRKGHDGLAAATLVLINIHSESERAAAEELAAQIGEMRAEESIAADIMPQPYGHDRRMTVRIANLAERRDPELRRALATAKRHLPRVTREE